MDDALPKKAIFHLAPKLRLGSIMFRKLCFLVKRSLTNDSIARLSTGLSADVLRTLGGVLK